MSVERLCADILARVEETKKSLRGYIEAVRAKHRGLLTALCMGTARNYKLLETLIKRCDDRLWGRARRNKKRKWLLLVSAYELVFRRDYVQPGRVAAYTGEHLAACLSNIEPEEAYTGLKGYAKLSVKYSIPLWVVRYLGKVCKDLEALLSSFQEEPVTWIRVNTRLISRDKAIRELSRLGVSAVPDNVLDDVVRVVSISPGSLAKLDPRKYYVMDKFSSLVAHIASRGVKGDLFLDSFSSPGNKLAHVNWRTLSTGVGVDISPGRIQVEKNLLDRQEASYILVNSDARSLPVREYSFTAAILDPDCTSMGRLGHSPETRFFLEEAGPSLVHRLARLQLKGLIEAARVVKPGGRIVYSTCTLTLEENEQVVEKAASKAPLAVLRAEPIIGVESPFLRGAQRLYPHISRTIGGFIALLEKTGR